MTQTELLALFDQYHDLVYRLALSYTGSIPDAEDAVQTVFLKLLEGTPPPQPGKERPWLSRVAVNCCRDLLRRRKYRRHESLEAAEQLFAQPEDRELYTAVMELPEKERAAVYLHYYEGYTFQEIGEILHISPSAVSMRLHRGRKKLQAILKEDGYETAVSKNL
mgnify:FL=1